MNPFTKLMIRNAVIMGIVAFVVVPLAIPGLVFMLYRDSKWGNR